MKKEAIPAIRIADAIHFFWSQKVMLDFDLAVLYGVTTGNLNKAVKRNRERFPADFMFQLSADETKNLIFQIGISKGRGGRRHRPFVFREQGVAMLSSILRGERAAQVNIAIMHAFVRLREAIEADRELAKRFAELEIRVGRHDEKIAAIIEAIRQLVAPKAKPRREIRFHVRETPSRYRTRNNGR
ncbi:MAG TPA: ORF6N domain-containing protein [Chthoniobacterales bacterium]|jgi:hypothetical protein